MANIGDNTIFSPSVFSPGILGRDNVFGTYIMDDRNGTGLLEQPFGAGASAAYSLYDLGNQRGTVVESEGTYHNPVVRLRRDSDGTHKSFSGVEIGNNTALNWVNEDVELIGLGNNNGGFESTLTDWSVSAGVSHDTVEFYAGAGSAKMTVTDGGSENISQPLLVIGNTYSVTFWAKISDDAKTFRVDFGTGNLNVINPSTTEWTQYTVEGVCSGNSTFRFFRGSSSGDYTVNFDNVVLTQLTSNAYATTWYDQSGVGVQSVFNDTDCSTANGWAQAGNTTLTVNYDSGDSGHASVFRLESGDGVAERVQLDDTYVDGTVYRVSFDHKYVTNSAAKGRIFVTSTQYGDITPSATWTRHELIWTQVGAGTSLRLYIDNNDGDAADEWLFDNIKVEVLDKAHNDATQATEASQPKVVDAGAYVVDANGNYSLSFDGTDDGLDLDASAFDIGTACTLVIASRDVTTDNLGMVAMSTNTPSAKRWYTTFTSGGNENFGYGTSTTAISAGTTDTALHIWTLATSASTVEGFKDGVSQGTAAIDTGYQANSGPELGQISAGSNFNGKMTAFLWYPVDDADTTAIEESLSDTITTALS